MKNDEFAFFNQQLAAMVRDGIPLETALRRLCADMRRSPLRAELEQLEADLAKGVPLRDAMRNRKLPELYRQMLEVGAQSNDLPGVLTMLADHYQRRHVIATRLKGLMVYPAIVLFATLLLSCFLWFLSSELTSIVAPVINTFNREFNRQESNWLGGIWLSPVILALVSVVLAFALGLPRFRRALRWKIPAFKDASLAQMSSALAIMLKSGVKLGDALGLVAAIERGTPVEPELMRWRQRLAEGCGKFSEMAANGTVVPALFVWTVAQSQEDLPDGFQRASEIYQSRASYSIEMLLYAALPCSVLVLGLVVLSQFHPVFASFCSFMETVGSN
jgi:type II secretory pathway component PulF